MIDIRDLYFHISTEHYSYIFRVQAQGLLEQLHFGPPVSTDDCAAFCHRIGCGWGNNIVLKNGDNGSSPDYLPLEWSGSGRGDYRESPLMLAGRSTDLRYVSHRVLEQSAAMTCGLPQAHGEAQALEVVLEQPGLRLTHYYTAFPTALTRRTVLENTGTETVTVTKLMSFCLDLPGNYHMTTFDGFWNQEMQRHTLPVLDSRIVNESTTGASSNRHNPGFLLAEPGANEDLGRVYGFNLVYSGNHYAAAQRSAQGLTRVMQGISPDNLALELAPGQKFETPEAVLAVSDAGYGGLSLQMHRFVSDHIIPEKWRSRSRPVLYNDWEGCGFQFDHNRLISLARRAKKLGCELFVLDDGWFGKRNNDLAGLGDYKVNKKKLPLGLQGLAKAVNKLGMEFGLWFEPESVNPDSDLYRAHPDWALTDEFEPVLGRNQLLLDLTKPQVRDYIVDNVSRILDSAPISYVKWDMNRHSVALGHRAHQYILGLYEVLGRIFGPRPQILLESCSSGGNRFDLGMLCYSPQIWCSDNTDPIERIGIQTSLSYLYPQSTFGAHVSAAPHSQTLRDSPLYTRANVSFFGCLGYELDLKLLAPVEVQQIQEQIRFYKTYRKLFQFGQLRRTDRGWQVSNGQTTLAAVFTGLFHSAPGHSRLRVKGLKPGVQYQLTSRPQGLRLKQFGHLLHHVSPVPLKPEGLLLRIADRHYALPDGSQQTLATGAALMSGVSLLPQYRGTGYDRDQRTQGDFGSNLYIIEPAP